MSENDSPQVVGLQAVTPQRNRHRGHGVTNAPQDKPGDKEARRTRQRQALELRLAGADYRQIGVQLGVSMKTAFYDVQTELNRGEALARKNAEKLREIELARCDKMTLGLWPKARAGDVNAVRSVVTIMERRARLAGLDAQPSKDGTLTIEQVVMALQGLMTLIKSHVNDTESLKVIEAEFLRITA
jgi:hypothetical protein